MAIAGKVAITLSTENDGKWSANVTYDRLTGVTHNNNFYISRKASTNVEPKTTDEFWFLAMEGFSGEDIENIIDGTTQVGNAKTLDGHKAEYFAKAEQVSGNAVLKTSILEHALTLERGVYEYYLGGSSYTGNDLPHGNYAYGNATIYKREAKYITVVLWGLNGVNDTTATNTYRDSAWTGWRVNATTADLAKYLPLTGGTVNSADWASVKINNTASDGVQVGLDFLMKGTRVGCLGFKGADNPIFYATNHERYSLLHTGNKPTGTYTGNGDATQRTINIGGIGSTVAIYSANGGIMSLVTSGGAITSSAGSVQGISVTEAKFVDGVLTLTTTSTRLNGNGIPYTYQVL